MKKQLIIIFLFLSFLISLGIPVSGETPPSTIEVDIPEYTVEKIGSYDYVDIPGGDILLVEGKPRVPYYSVSIEYPKGYRVQDVVMKERSGLVTATGSNLTTVTIEPDSPSSGETSSSKQGGWYPKENYKWKAWINSEGNSTLIISIFPFYYNDNTTDVKFYKNYRFDIEYIISNVEITALQTDKDIYEPGEEVTVEMWLNNSGEAQDVVVNTVIKQYGTDEIVDGLPLKMLKNFAGEGSYSANWNANDTESSYYYAEVTLTDTSGNVLDRKTVGFAIQAPEAIEKEKKGFPGFELILIIGGIALAMMLKKRKK